MTVPLSHDTHRQLPVLLSHVPGQPPFLAALAAVRSFCRAILLETSVTYLVDLEGFTLLYLWRSKSDSDSHVFSLLRRPPLTS